MRNRSFDTELKSEVFDSFRGKEKKNAGAVIFDKRTNKGNERHLQATYATL